QSLTHRLHTISGNVASIRKQIGILGTKQEKSNTREEINSQVKVTREVVTWVNADLKKLGGLDCSQEREGRQRKSEYQKLVKDFQLVLKQFQNVQRISIDKTRDYVTSVKSQDVRNDESLLLYEESQEVEVPLLNLSSTRYEQQILSSELEWHESLVHEREAEIREIERGIVELNEIFHDLGNIVHTQQSQLDNIEHNVTLMSMNISYANDELSKANRFARKRKSCLSSVLIALFVMFMLLLLIAMV
ncbi:t-SNARE, partial [Basidiobolus meristosporus CBS 931.73]